MNVLDGFNIDIFKLNEGSHNYEFKFEEDFFAEFEDSIIEIGRGDVRTILEKNESFMKLAVTIEGEVELECDRSLDKFMYHFKTERRFIFKYGEEEQELDDEIIIITRNKQRLNIAQYIYECIGLEVPMKKLHPRFGKEENENDELIYSSETDQEEEKPEIIDPRWDKLKNLK
jgi:uncharacterized protein